MVLDGGGVVEEGLAAVHRRFQFLLDEACHIGIRDPAALVLHILHLIGKAGGLRAHPAVDIFPVVEPVVSGVEERGPVAVGVKDPEETVQIPVHHPERGGGGGGEGVGLHAGEDVKLRVGGAAREARHHHMAGDGVGIGAQGVEIGQGVIFLRVGKDIGIGDVGEGLVHHHDDVDVFPQTGDLARFPGLCFRLVKALRLVDGVGGELVAEAVGEAQFVENGGDVVGVGYPEGVVKVVGGVHCQDEDHQHSKAGGGAQSPAQPTPQPGDGEGLSPDHKAQQRQSQGYQHHQDDGAPGIMDVIGAHGTAHFFQEGKVPGEHRLIPHFHLDAVGDGESAHGKVHHRRAVKDVAQQKGQHQQQKADGHGVEDDQQGLSPEHSQHAAQGVGLTPQGQKGDAPRQQYCSQQRTPPGQPDFGKTVPNLQIHRSFPKLNMNSTIIVILPGKARRQTKKAIRRVFFSKKIPSVSKNGGSYGP